MRRYSKVLHWDCMVLCHRYFPTADWDDEEDTQLNDAEAFGLKGFPLAADMFCVVWNIKCDGRWSQNQLHLEGAGCLLMCPWCGATNTDDAGHEQLVTWDLPVAPWNDISDDAVWRRRK